MSDWLEDAVQREGDALFADHPTSDLLVGYAEKSTALSPAELRAVASHLRVCGACNDDLVRLRAAISELESQSPRPSRTPTWRDRLLGWLRPSSWLPAVAVAALAVAYIASTRSPQPEVEPLARSIGRAVVLRVETERGEVTAIRPGADGQVALMFEMPAAADGPIASCSLTLVDSDSVTWARIPEARALDDFGTFLITFDASTLASGRYSLVARDRLGERRFELELSR